MGKIIEGLWDCEYCGNTGIRASEKQCPYCGSPQNNNTKFYIGDPHNYVSEENAKKISRNPDWLCSFCDSLNPDDAEVCRNCGASKTESELNYFTNQEKKERASAKNDYNDTTEFAKRSKIDSLRSEKISCNDTKEHIHKKSNTKILKNIWIGLLGVLLVITFVFGTIKVFQKTEKTVSVTDVFWNRNIEIEELKTVQESDWTVPSGGRVLYQQQEIRTYDRELDHYEQKTVTKSRQVLSGYESYVSGYRDLGNGYFEEVKSQRPVYRTEYYTEIVQEPVYVNVPVYDTKYYYEIDKWVHSRNIKTSGHDKSPEWGSVTLQIKEREGERSEKYCVTAIDAKDRSKEYSFSFDEWNKIDVGMTIKIKSNMLGSAEILWE